MSEAEIVVTAPAVQPQPATALAVVQDSPAPDLERVEALSRQLSVMDGMWVIAEKIARTPFGAAHGNKPENVFGVMMKGYEVGLQPMQSLDSVDFIQGKPTLKPETMRALIRAHGHDFEVVEQSDERCVMRAHRKEWPADKWTTWEFTRQHAIDMKLHTKDNWQKQFGVMLFSRCTSKMGRGEFADVLKGLSYTPDELNDSIEAQAVEIQTPREVAGALQVTTASEPEPASEEDRSRVRSAIAELSDAGKDDLKAWWTPDCGLSAYGVDRISAEDVEPLLAKIKTLPKAAPAVNVQPMPVAPPPAAPPVQEPSGPSGFELLKVVCRELEISPPTRDKILTKLLNRQVKKLEAISETEAKTVADTLNGMGPEQLEGLLGGLK